MRGFVALGLALLATGALAQAGDDALDDAVHTAMVGALTGDASALASAQRDVQRVDAARRAAGEAPTGIGDNLATLANATMLTGRPDFARAQRAAARRAGTPEERRELRALADAEPWPTIQRLRHENRYNRFATAVNWVLRRTSQILTLQFQAVLQAGNDIAFSHRAFLYPTARERKIRALAARLATEAPDTPEGREAAGLAESIGRKVERDHRRDTLRRCRVAAQQGQWELARELAAGALELWPGDEEFTRRMRDADHELGIRRRSLERSLQVDPIGEASLTDLDWEDLGDALRAWMIRDDKFALFLLDQVHHDAPAESPIRGDTELVSALVLADSPDLTDARAQLQTLARSDARTPAPALAGEILHRPPFDPERDVDDAVARRRQLSRRFIWQGARGVDENLYLASSSAISQGLGAPMALGFFFFVDSAIRAVSLGIRNPLGAERIVDALAALDRRQGSLSDAQLTMLRDRLRDLGAFDRALEAHERLPHPDPAMRGRLTNRLAEQFLETAKAEGDPEIRRRLLSHVVEDFPSSPSAAEAWRLLHSEPWEGTHLTADLTRSALRELTEAGWPLPPELADGSGANGEIDDSGVWVESNGTVRYRRRDSRVWEAAQPRQGDGARLSAAAKAVADQAAGLAVLDARRRPRVPLEITGSLGASGVYAAPQLQRYRYIDDDLPLFE